jgi:hypothetical protein
MRFIGKNFDNSLAHGGAARNGRIPLFAVDDWMVLNSSNAAVSRMSV